MASATSSIVESVECIYANGKHNTTPDIVKWRDAYYVVFISGTHHLKKDHVAVILRSNDLERWETVFTSPYPARDTTLLALPDRLLMYYVFFNYPGSDEPGYVERRYHGGGENKGSVESRVAVSRDGVNWTDPQTVYQPLQNFWRPILHDGQIFVATDYIDTEGAEILDDGWYHGNGPAELSRVDLLRSGDGLQWERISTIVSGGNHTETEILFRPDGELWAVSRPATFARSRPPYTTWRTQRLSDGTVGGPGMIEVDGRVYLGGRHYGLGEGVWGTALWRYEPQEDNFSQIALLPEVGHYDLSYPGFVAAGDATAMVYYSSHQHGTEHQSPVQNRSAAARADIFLARLRL